MRGRTRGLIPLQRPNPLASAREPSSRILPDSIALALLSLAAAPQEKVEYSFKGEAMEACECESVCPCIWTKDTTFGNCRATVAFNIAEGNHGKTDLKGVPFVLVLTQSTSNMAKGLGKWEGRVYLPDQASAEQRKAVEGFFRGKWGGDFAKLEFLSAAIEMKSDPDHKEVSIGKVSTVKITALKNQEGKTPTIENAPLSLYPKLYCAKADANTYNDGTSKWDFAGHNAFFGPFEYSST